MSYAYDGPQRSHGRASSVDRSYTSETAKRDPDKGIAGIKDALQAIVEDAHANPGRRAQVQAALHQIEHLVGLEGAPGQREKDLAAVRKALHDHDLDAVVQASAGDAYKMVVAGDQWERLRREHPDHFVLGDAANLEALDANKSDNWIIGGPGGTGISAAEIVLAKNKKAHVTMVGQDLPPGLLENDQFREFVRAHADKQTAALYERRGGIHVEPGDGRFSLVLGIDIAPPTLDKNGQVQLNGKDLGSKYIPDGYTKEDNPFVGAGGYISSIGRDNQLPPIAAELKRSMEARGGTMTMELLWDDNRQYVGYRLNAKNKAGEVVRRLDVTGAASRFPPWELMDPKEHRVDVELREFRKASDLDAPPESGNFDGGLNASATQAARYARYKRNEEGATP